MSKKQVPKFLLCHNEMADDSIYIFHTQTPRFLAKVEGNNINIVQEIDHLLVNATEIAGIMRRMGDWYVTYMKYKKNH